MEGENISSAESAKSTIQFRTKAVWRLRRRLRQTAGILVTGLLIALGCVALLAGISWARSQPAVNVVRAQIEAIRDGKVEQAYAFFSSDYQAGMTLPMFRRWLRRREQLTHLRNLQFWGRSVWGGTALLQGSFQDELGNHYPVRYWLVRENGTWRVYSLQLPAAPRHSQPSSERFVRI